MLQSSTLLFVFFLVLASMAMVSGDHHDPLGKALVFYASFDDKVAGDFGGGKLEFATRFNDPKEQGKYIVKEGYPKEAFRIAKNQGIAGGCLEAVDVLPDNGRIFIPAKGNLPFKKGGWGGALSVWINTDPNKLLKTTFCDPIQITQKGANNGGLWFDFNNDRPRTMRMGAFPAIPEGQKGLGEDDPQSPLVKVPAVSFKSGDWHHLLMNWFDLDVPRSDGKAVLYIDGKMIGAVDKKPLAMDWDLDRTGIFVAVNYIGLLDELAIFNRPLTEEEVNRIRQRPSLVKEMKK